MRKDLVCGLIALALAGVYLNEATKIQVSALGDTVGAGGFPLILGSLLAVAALLLLLQSFLARRSAGADGPSAEVEGEAESPGYGVRRAAGLTVIAAAFIAMLPLGGYVVAVALLLAAVMLYQGLPFSRRTILVAGGGAIFLYGLFGLLLGIPVPRGLWASLLG
jgi:putative tricarboxylic transport membrane protein